MVYISIVMIVISILSGSAQIADKRLLFSDTFEHDLSNWTIEQALEGTAEAKNGKLEINDRKGCTVWFNHKLSDDVKIVFDIVMIDSGGIYDHVRDMNFFFKGVDPENPEDIFIHSQKRSGKLTNYHGLKTYYIGYGGNHNTTTRFRKYRVSP